MIELSPSDTIRRYLAFRIIVNAMAFEDLVNGRQHARMRKIRDVLLAHKQEPEFFEGYRAVDEIRDITIRPLIDMMTTSVGSIARANVLPEVTDPEVSAGFSRVAPLILQKYQDEEVQGFRVTNNFLCFEGNQVQEISKSDLSGCFYRYNSSKALMTLANFLTNNLGTIPELLGSVRHAKLDLILHSINMADCVLKDLHNKHSIDGLREILTTERIGDAAALNDLDTNPRYKELYRRIRRIRNKLVGHMDKNDPLAQLLNELDILPFNDIFELINLVDFATHTVARSHIAIWTRYVSTNIKLNDANVVAVKGIKVTPYF